MPCPELTKKFNVWAKARGRNVNFWLPVETGRPLKGINALNLVDFWLMRTCFDWSRHRPVMRRKLGNWPMMKLEFGWDGRFRFFLPKFNINNWLEVKNSISWKDEKIQPHARQTTRTKWHGHQHLAELCAHFPISPWPSWRAGNLNSPSASLHLSEGPRLNLSQLDQLITRKFNYFIC